MKQKWKHWLHALEDWESQCRPRGLVLLALALAILLVGYGAGYWEQGVLRQRLAEAKMREGYFDDERRNFEKALAAKSLEVKMEQQSQQETRAMMARQRMDLVALQTELAFYRNIMAPEKTADGVFIHDFLLDDTTSPNRFRYRLVLTQQKIRKRFAKGKVELLLAGSLNGKAVQKPVTELGIDSKDLKFSFRYFQQLEGEFSLPDGFLPERFVVKVDIPKRKGQKSADSQTDFGFDELLKQHQTIILDDDKA